MISKNFKSFLKDYFTLTSRERRGAISLAFLICIQISVIVWLNYFSEPGEPLLSEKRYKISGFIKKMETKRKIKESERNSTNELKVENLFAFDPNQINDADWLKLGLSPKQTAIIRNFINKGGVFRKKEDLSKIYGLSPSHYQALEPFIKIPEKQTYKNNDFRKEKILKVDFQKVNINIADTTELAKLPLIGPGRARMIFKYREAIGGFHTPAQLLEVFTIDSTVLVTILPKIIVNPLHIRKINFNSDSLRHPYLTRQIITAIKSYRKQHGNLSNPDDLNQIEIISNELMSKLAPYVAFE